MNEESSVFTMEGEAIDHEWILAHRKEIESYMYDEVRDAGFLPILDVPTSLDYSYDAEQEIFNYKIDMLMYRVGVNKSHEYYGILINDGVLLDRSFEGVSLAEGL